MPDEGELLDRACDGDSAAWAGILELHAPHVLGIARDRLKRSGADPSLAEDIVQEVWVALLAGGGRNLRGIDPALGMRGYLSASAIRAVHRHLKSSSSRRVREEGHALPPAPGVPEEPLLRAEKIQEVETALASLEPEERVILRWTYWEGLSYAQAGRLAGLKESSVGPALTRAREKFKEALERNKTARGKAGKV